MTAGRMRFWRDTPYTHSVGRKRRCPNCARQAKRYGCALLYGGTARLTADDSLPFAHLPIGAPGRRAEMAGFQFSPQENEGEAPSPYPDCLRPRPCRAACPCGRRWWLTAHSVLAVGC